MNHYILQVIDYESFYVTRKVSGSYCNLERIGLPLGSIMVGMPVSDRWVKQLRYAITSMSSDGLLQQSLTQYRPQAYCDTLESDTNTDPTALTLAAWSTWCSWCSLGHEVLHDVARVGSPGCSFLLYVAFFQDTKDKERSFVHWITWSSPPNWLQQSMKCIHSMQLSSDLAFAHPPASNHKFTVTN